MSEKFAKKWGEGVNDTPLSNKIKDAVRPPGPLKPRLDFAVKRMEMQIQRLDKAADRFSDRDKSIFARTNQYLQKSLTHTQNTTWHEPTSSLMN